jgi:tRNA-dihydrouridine synthase B
VVGLRNARKHIGWYLASSGRSAGAVQAWRRQLCTSDDVRAVRAGLGQFYDQALEAAA